MSAAALVVHDLKNELGALEAGLERLAQRPDAMAAAAAHRQCSQLRQRFVMYLTLYGGGDLRAHPEDESPVELLQSAAARHGNRVQAACRADAPPFWYFDRRLVAMALDAAIHNALRFARQRVVLGLRIDGSHLVLTVDDDGPGIGPAGADADHNTGLGTTLCRTVAQLHGGGVRLFDRPQGGARFELSLAT